jgi:hypothetical protein
MTWRAVSAVEQLPDLTRDHRDYLWKTGWPLHLCYSQQRDLSRRFSEHERRVFVVKCARRFGKSWWACVEALGFALRTPNARILYLAPTAKQVRMIIEPHMHRILADCPASLRPDHRKQDGQWNFANGAILYMAGVDNGNAERLRGIEAHLVVFDEPGSMSDLEYVAQSIVLPQTLTTNGRIVMIGTPPVHPAHDFAQVYCRRAMLDGSLVEKTIHDAKHIAPEIVSEYAKEEGGEDSIAWRREYLVQDVYDSESSIVPEFTRLESELVEERERPRFARRYVVGDTGFVDLSFWIFAYVDFEKALLVVEDELVFTATAASDQAKALAAKERELWGSWGQAANDNGKPQRYADAADLVRVEFPKGEPGYNVAPVNNQDLDATVNALRRATQERRYRIHPQCRQLIAHVKMGTWNRQRTNFDRVDGYGHFDGVAALMYAVKHASIRTNPFPDVPPEANREDWYIPAQKPGKGAPGLAQLKRGANR